MSPNVVCRAVSNSYIHVILYLGCMVIDNASDHLTNLPKKVATSSAVLQLQFCLLHDIVITCLHVKMPIPRI